MPLQVRRQPARRLVVRQFETNRLAQEFQRQAYEEALPLVHHSRTRVMVPAQAGTTWAATTLIQQEGVAA